MMNRQHSLSYLVGLSWMTLGALGISLYLALFFAPTDALQGHVQRLFYPHLASFVGAFVGFISAVIGGVAYLRTRQARWDWLALAGVEVGLLLATINILTGMLYARPIVNGWWTWDPKLTAVAVMALTYASYLTLRQGVISLERRRIFASVYGVLAFSSVIYVFAVIRLRDDVLHNALFVRGGGFWSLPERVQFTLLISIMIWALLIAPTLMLWRIYLEYLRDDNARQLAHHLGI